MAGVKGRSGGRRANTGGARPGAGRKPNPIITTVIEPPPQPTDPKDVLMAIMTNAGLDVKLRIQAAQALMPYVHARKVEHSLGKKEEREVEALTAHNDTQWDLFLAPPQPQ